MRDKGGRAGFAPEDPKIGECSRDPIGLDPVLNIRSLSVDFVTPRGRVHALRAVSLTVPRNQIVGVVGESGSGKTTLVLAALALLPGNAEVTGGEVIVRGQERA